MVYLEHSGTKFWRCELTAARTVTIAYGKCGSAGRTMKKTDFGDKQEAQDYVKKQTETKRKAGYEDATDPNGSAKKSGGTKRKKAAASAPPAKKRRAATSAPAAVAVSPKKRKAATPAAASPTSPTKKSRVSGAAMSPGKSASAALAGTVDPAVSFALQSGTVYVRGSKKYDVMLNQTNLAANNNKFYKIQLVQTAAGVFLFTRWGRVGENGATQELGPMDSNTAIKEYQKKFKSKARKYTVVEMEEDAEAAEKMSTVDLDATRDIMKQYEQSFLDKEMGGGGASPSSDFGF